MGRLFAFAVIVKNARDRRIPGGHIVPVLFHISNFLHNAMIALCKKLEKFY